VAAASVNCVAVALRSTAQAIPTPESSGSALAQPRRVRTESAWNSALVLGAPSRVRSEPAFEEALVWPRLVRTGLAWE
jgi:hypothetical protein